MKEHLKRKHPADNPTEDGYKQRKLDVLAKKRSCSSEQAGAISERIAMMIVKDLRPINIVNGEGFQQLIGFLEPEYRLPSATHLTLFIENRYKAEKQKFVTLSIAKLIILQLLLTYGPAWPPKVT